MGQSIMFQGTASNVGKSFLVAAFCRIFKEDGLEVIPFKSQNMALNSYITEEGLEMGRAQVVQAEAAGKVPSVKMNPILLKPHADKQSQVIINGKVYKDMTAVEYHEFKPQLAEMIQKVFEEIQAENDAVVIEGAGSPAEINLRDKDIVNMGLAELVDAPVVLIGDIDRGGVFASIVGTMMLLTEEERKRVKGVLINKFRGDVKILEPGLKMLEELIQIPVLGVIPYSRVDIEDEDSLAGRLNSQKDKSKKALSVEVICLPHMSNFTDFNVLEIQEDVSLRYVTRGQMIGDPDLLILPGTKNTIGDLLYLKESGLGEAIKAYSQKGKLIFGICGGYQLLGKKLYDPKGVEMGISEIDGLGLLDISTYFEEEKVTTQVEGQVKTVVGDLGEGLKDKKVVGYEIHMGVTHFGKEVSPLFEIQKKLGKEVCYEEGAVNKEGTVMGTYLHGVFDEVGFTRGLLNGLRRQKGLTENKEEGISFKDYKEQEYKKLAEVVRKNVDMEAIYKILRGEEI
ncbi:cobyric acid synthase CobQ [Sporanaerobium hydrogeniformans]|uniref:Cobyric acid synthase CobQ n=1 Tax=Sporanaerobium hydrogeniformans TaxID=3072179 RepID=A0AC61DCS6_9FIRM|nr:cobyric acid synthase [Sporanaerobium hydrogeniformans]PHV70996.1 cobyric acid synthase CobQ [Sporanaerobium hydrogeniformans]